jgi:hypothetical protein
MKIVLLSGESNKLLVNRDHIVHVERCGYYLKIKFSYHSDGELMNIEFENEEECIRGLQLIATGTDISI